MKQKSEYRVGIGASSILMILVVLALTAISLLSYNSARGNKALTERNTTMTVAYYQAAAEVQRKLSVLDQVAYLHRGENATAEEWRGWLTEAGLSDLTLSDDGVSFRLEADAGEQRAIEVEGLFTPQDENRYTITLHELVNRATGETTETLTLLR